MRANSYWHVIAVGTVAVLALGACGGDDDADASGSTTSTEADEVDDVAVFCDAIDGMGLSVSIGEGYEGIDEALVAAEDIAPDEISADVTTMADENRAQVAAGTPAEGAPPNIPPDEFFTAAAAVGDYMADNCRYQVIDVTATDHDFEGIPANAKAGKTLIQITNDGTEYHEVVIERIPQGETRSLEEIVALPDGEEGDLLDYLGSAFAAPGGGSWTVVDLAGGRHAALCFVPTGATTPEALLSEGADTTQRHTGEGMFAEMQIT